MAESRTDREADASISSRRRRRMRPYGYLSLTRSRLRAHPWYELLATAGIAIGVALSAAVLLANASISSSSRQLVGGIADASDMQLQTRSSTGIPAGDLLQQIRAVRGVERAIGVLEQRAAIVGPDGATESIDVVGIGLSDTGVRSTSPATAVLDRGLVLPEEMARRIGLPIRSGIQLAPRPAVRLELRGRAELAEISAIAGPDVLGETSDPRAAVTSLERLRALAGLPDRLTRVLIETTPGQEQTVNTVLTALSGGRLEVTDLDADGRLLDQAQKPAGQATSFFAFVASLLGFLLAFNAVLLSAPERRRWLSDLITFNGASPRSVLLLVIGQSVALGIAGSLIGIVAGVFFASCVLDASADYLAPAFTLGTRTDVPIAPLVFSAAAGLCACFLATVPLLLDLRRGRSLESVFATDEEPGNHLSRTAMLRLLVAAAAFTMGMLAILAFWPNAALLACGLLAVATVMTVPTTFQAIVTIAGALERRHSRRFVLLSIALRELRATTLRSLALASTGAVAVFGAVAISGARADLLRGIERYVNDYVGTADVWVTHYADNQATIPFPLTQTMIRQLAAVPGVNDVRTYFGSFLDVDDRRIWIVARNSDDPHIVPPSQLRDGDAKDADASIRAGGSVAISDKLAAHLGAKRGDMIALPTPAGERTVRVAATTSNFGWPLGAIVMSADDYRAWWRTNDPSAIQVDTASDHSSSVVAERLRQQLKGSGLQVQTAEQRAAVIRASARQGLSRIGQISTLLLISACLAMAAALSAAIWQRRPRFSQHDLLGMLPSEQWRALLIESGLVIGAGCLTGAVFGAIGQIVIDTYLIGVTGFPVAISIATGPTVFTFFLVLGSALAVVAVPGWRAAHVGGATATDE